MHHILHRVDINRRTHRLAGNVDAVSTQLLNLNLEAGGDKHVLQFPGVSGIQTDIGLDDFNRIHITCLDVDVVNRIVLRSLAGIIVASQVNQSLILRNSHGKGGVLLGHITHAVSDLKGNPVLAIVPHNSLGSRHAVAADLRLNLHAVHIDLRRSSIQANVVVLGLVVVDTGGEDHFGSRNGRAVEHLGIIGSGIHNVANNGLLTVIHSRAVVQGHVVEVEGQLLRIHGLDVHADERGRTGIGVSREGIHGGQVLVCAHVDVCIHPAARRNIRLHGIVQRLDLAAGGLEAEMLLVAVIALSVLGAPELGHERQAALHVLLRVIRVNDTRSTFRDVHPEAEGGSSFLIFFRRGGKNIAENMLLTHEEQVVVAPTSKISISVVQRPAQRIVAIFNLTIALVRQESIGCNLIVVLTRQRIGTNQRVVHAISDTPLLGSHKAHPVGDVAVFEVPGADQFRALAIGDGKG